MAAAGSNAVGAGGASTPACGANLAAALGPTPVSVPDAATAAASGTAVASSGTGGVSAAVYGTGGNAGDSGKNTEVCRFHKY